MNQNDYFGYQEYQYGNEYQKKYKNKQKHTYQRNPHQYHDEFLWQKKVQQKNPKNMEVTKVKKNYQKKNDYKKKESNSNNYKRVSQVEKNINNPNQHNNKIGQKYIDKINQDSEQIIYPQTWQEENLKLCSDQDDNNMSTNDQKFSKVSDKNSKYYYYTQEEVGKTVQSNDFQSQKEQKSVNIFNDSEFMNSQKFKKNIKQKIDNQNQKLDDKQKKDNKIDDKLNEVLEKMMIFQQNSLTQQSKLEQKLDDFQKQQKQLIIYQQEQEMKIKYISLQIEQLKNKVISNQNQIPQKECCENKATQHFQKTSKILQSFDKNDAQSIEIKKNKNQQQNTIESDWKSNSDDENQSQIYTKRSSQLSINNIEEQNFQITNYNLQQNCKGNFKNFVKCSIYDQSKKFYFQQICETYQSLIDNCCSFNIKDFSETYSNTQCNICKIGSDKERNLLIQDTQYFKEIQEYLELQQIKEKTPYFICLNCDITFCLNCYYYIFEQKQQAKLFK